MDFPVSRRLPGTWISGPVVEFVLPEDLRPAGNSPVALQVRFPCQLSQGDSTWTFRCPDASPGPGFRGLWSNLYCPKTFARREIRLWRFKCDSPASVAAILILAFCPLMRGFGERWGRWKVGWRPLIRAVAAAAEGRPGSARD